MRMVAKAASAAGGGTKRKRHDKSLRGDVVGPAISLRYGGRCLHFYSQSVGADLYGYVLYNGTLHGHLLKWQVRQRCVVSTTTSEKCPRVREQ